jgi:hypothetical protein
MTCDTCPFFSATDGSCRADPPKAMPTREGNVVGVWPGTSKHGWCGRHPDRKNLPATIVGSATA